MKDPIFVLGCHRSGTSVVAGLLYHACGVEMGELMPPTEDNPLGYFESLGVVDAHRDLLAQMERDWTCPPSLFRPRFLDLTALQEQVDLHHDLPEVWAMKDPRSMFLLRAWSHLGLDRVRLVAVVRPVTDTVRSIEKRDNIREDRAEAIVDAYLRRLVEIAGRVPLPVIEFPGEGDGLIPQVRKLAASLGLDWDEDAARAFFDETLVRNRSLLRDSSPAYDELLHKARFPDEVPAISIQSLALKSEPEWPLETHLSVRHAQQRRQLWEMAEFSGDSNPEVVDLLREGARPGGIGKPGVTLHQIEVTSPLGAGAAIMKENLRPHAVVASGLLTGHSMAEVEFFFRSMYVNTHPLAELVVDVPDPKGEGLAHVTPAVVDYPRRERVEDVAKQTGWDHVRTERLSKGLSGLQFRKRVLADHELIPVVTDLIANLQRIQAIDQRLGAVERHLSTGAPLKHRSAARLEEVELGQVGQAQAERQRADDAEEALGRLQNRRSVKLALAMSKPFRPLFKMFRS